ncbi:Zinc finger, DPH-type,DnaJ domain,ALKBH8, RNA recognition motif,Oxoglutarate/iron-dependent [Cinara cedri]|uniref:Zinc finger, DPH-type,DnaJ domain,ALKBH8, RNA recognition motif,Oxoglutarate/iron-dependent n=1 Tax=Cinara cedri TaxID=506608 RepID=A0A5E4MT10_9HEMI|nr:Zinc finger, DPH-type,DnaJ domain,ALKBH8, RNA recognition motif,Oxoglutarate/iron-dependent [Cinara cedri]
MEQKLYKKRLKYESILKKDLDIDASSSPTTNLMVCNYGLVNGLSRKDVLQVFSRYGTVDCIIMVPHKSYCFICYANIQEAISAYAKVNGKMNTLSDQQILYLIYTNSVPKSVKIVSNSPPGLEIIDNFIEENEENFLLLYFKEHWSESSTMKHRQVKHYGYEFDYDNNGVRYDTCDPIPKEFNLILNAIQSRLKWCPNQITVNKYLPGQGIPSHTDTRGVFDDYIVSLSLGSDIVMEFRKDNYHNSVLLKSKSLLVMSGESRFNWTHGITPRKFDVINTVNGPDVLCRGTRISVTFRRVIQNQAKENLYEVLGCDKTTSFETLKENYRKLLIKFHPDKSISSSTTAACAELNKAWNVLKDPDAKKAYDEQIEQSDIDTEVTVFETLNVSDLENNEMSDTLSYRCRCGGSFLVPKSIVLNVDQIEPILFPCDDCSLFIKIILPNIGV